MPISVVVPAHDEQMVIGRLLDLLVVGREPGDEIVVSCDGCADRTAEIARSFPDVTVLETPRHGKIGALRAGEHAVESFPRFFVDADVIVSSAALHEVARRMSGGLEAGAPRCVVDTDRSSYLVRAYYRVWTRLPYFTDGILGSGVFGVTRAGRARFAEFPDVIGDDEFVRRLFRREERVRDVGATFTVFAPRTARALVRIKTRSRLGSLQLDQLQGAADPGVGRSRSDAVVQMVCTPSLWVPALVYIAFRIVVEIRARRRARAQQFGGWARDETSRV